jgi:BASS family bile acid:Na+ symporter
MEALKDLIPLIFALSLAVLVLNVGLDAEPGDLLHLFRRPRQLLKAVLAVNVLVPVAAALLVAALPISHVAKAGILLMAMSPVPPLVPGKEKKIGGSRAYSYGLYTALILLAVVVVPVSVAIAGWIYGASIAIPPLAVARNVLLTVVAPLVIGLVIHRFAPKFAARAAKVLNAVAMLLLLTAFIPMLIGAWPAFATLIGDGTVVAMALVGAFALAAGHLLGGPDRQDRAALAVTSATRHPGIALMIAKANTEDPRVSAAIIGFMIVGLLVAVPYQLWIKRTGVHAA